MMLDLLSYQEISKGIKIKNLPAIWSEVFKFTWWPTALSVPVLRSRQVHAKFPSKFDKSLKTRQYKLSG